MAATVSRQIVGREAELRELVQLLDSATDGPAALLLEGDPGIGKTTVWKEALAEAGNRGFRVLSCGPAEVERELAFAALGDLLEPALEKMLPSLPAPQRRALDVALLRAEAGARGPDQRAVSVATLAAIRSLSVSSPVLLAIDDVQWLDRASARVLEFAIRRLEQEPISVLVTQRPNNEPGTPLALDRSLTERFDRLRLSPLGPEALDRLLRERLGAAFLRPTLLQLHRTSGGNPFFALELGRALLASEHTRGPAEPLPVPDNLKDLLEKRLAQLPRPVREGLRVVAALSEPTVPIVEAVVGQDAAAQLATAAAEGVVELDGDRIRFSHPLLAAAVYAELAPDARHRLHRLLAERAPGREERARHLARGTEQPDESVAAELDEVARRALARGAPEAAAELAEHARRLTPAHAKADLDRRTVEAADHHLQAGDTARAKALLEEVVAHTPDGELLASALHRLARVRTREESHALAVQLLERGLGLTNDPMLRARIELDLTIEVLQSGELALARTHAHAALALAETIGEPALLVEGLVNVAMVDFLLGKGTANDLISRAEQLAEDENRRSDLAPTLLHPEFTAATLLKWADEFEPARRKFEALLRLARERNEEGWIAPILFQLGELECWFGNWEVAGRYADRARETASQLGSPSMGTLAVYLRALVDAHLGRIDDARAGAERAVAAFERSSNVRHLIRSRGLLGFIALSFGDAADARRHLGAAGELSTACGYADPGVLRFQADLIEALVGVGDIDQAEALTDELAERGRSLDRPWARATSARCRGLVCAARGDPDEALRALDQALLEHERLLQPFEYARTLFVLGSVRRRARQKRSAREALEQARDLFERLGTPLWAEKAHEQLRRIGGRAPAPTGLTPTEEKIAELVAQGSTNPEVAETLFMSRKTVERHLTHIFQKLDVRSRRELARAFAARNRADRP